MILSLLFTLFAAAPGTVVVVAPDPPADRSFPWLAEAVAEQLPRSLAFLGVPAVDRADRLRAQAALEIPLVPLTRATSIRMAEALGASRIVTGAYAIDAGSNLELSLRILDVERGTLSAPLVAQGPLDSVADLVDRLAYDIALTGPTAPVRTRDDLAALRAGVPFTAVKALGEGLAARSPGARLRQVRSALQLAPSFQPARLALARLLMEQREFSAAYETLSRVPAGSPLSRTARFEQGVALLEVGRYREAAALFAALARDSATPAVFNNHALALLRDGDRGTRAAEVLQQAMALGPESIDVAFNHAWALLAEGDPQGAAFALRALIARAPLDQHARVVLAWALRKAGRTSEADEEWKAVAALAPGFDAFPNPDLTRRFERILRSEQMFEAGRETRRPAEVAASLLARAQRALDAGQLDEALREATRSAFLDPSPSRIHLVLARIHRARGQHERALSEYRITLWAKDDAGVRLEVATLLREMGRAAEARTEAEKALKLDPTSAAAKSLLESL